MPATTPSSAASVTAGPSGRITGGLSAPHQVGLLLVHTPDRRILGDFLTSLGHTVCAPVPSPECMDTWQDVSLAIVDEVCARDHLKGLFELKRRSGSISLPLLIAVGGSRNGAPWLEAGFDDVLRLPVTKAELTARLVALLRLRQESEERYLAEEALRRRADDLVAADRQKDEFLAMLAHELRNPLSPILSAAETLRLLSSGEPAWGKPLDIIERQANQLARIVDDLLDVARVTQGRIILRKEPVVLTEAIDRAVQAVLPLVESRRHTLTLSMPSSAVVLDADPARLEQILVNLLINAAKYTEPGGRITLAAERSRREVILRVRDTGRGIPPDMLPHVFDLFAQVNPSVDRSSGGLGLGLTLVRTLVGMHGGSVTVTSAGSGEGSEFCICLPALTRSVARRKAPPRRVSAFRAHRILIVDDNVDAAETLADLLQIWGHEVRIAGDGRSGIEAVQSDCPDMVLLDIGLPDMDGYEVARRLGRHPERERMRLVALTGYGQEEDRRRAHEAGFDLHLVKPVDSKILAGVLAGIPGHAQPS